MNAVEQQLGIQPLKNHGHGEDLPLGVKSLGFKWFKQLKWCFNIAFPKVSDFETAFSHRVGMDQFGFLNVGVLSLGQSHMGE